MNSCTAFTHEYSGRYKNKKGKDEVVAHQKQPSYYFTDYVNILIAYTFYIVCFARTYILRSIVIYLLRVEERCSQPRKRIYICTVKVT